MKFLRQFSRHRFHVMQNHRSGDTVTVTLYRGKKPMEIKVILVGARGVT